MKLLTLFTLIIIWPLTGTAQTCQEYNDDLKGLTGCAGKNIHLSFDDGPNTTTTPKIIETLKRQKVKATFFVSTHQLEKGALPLKKKLISSMFENEFTVASHGHDHNCHDIRYDWEGNLQPGYTDEQRREQLEKSVILLNQFSDNRFSKQNKTLLRFPYGRGISPSPKEIEKMIKDGRHIEGSSYSEKLNYYRAHSPAMGIASEYKLSHIGWNHDSKDSTTSYDKSNKDKYITDQLSTICKSNTNNFMTLFHDTRAINSMPSKYNKDKTVMDELIEKAKCLKMNFLSMDEFLKKKIQGGIYTKAYTGVTQVADLVPSLNSINSDTNSPNPICLTPINNKNKTIGASCYSKYIGEVRHCQGLDSFCIDGQWIKSKSLFNSTCHGNIPSEIAKILSSQYINKICTEASAKRVISANKAVCYCQEQAQDQNQLKWNCFDISSSSTKKF